MPMKLTRELLAELPKSDLHLHLDGSLRPATLIELARERGVKLPAYSERGLLEKVFKQHYRSLDEYLRGFALTCAVLQDAEALERASYELCVDCQNEGVRYIEIRFAPQLHASPNFSTLEVLQAVACGIDRAESLFNNRPEVVSAAEPPFRAGILVCAMRFFMPSFSRNYSAMFEAFPEMPEEQLFGLASEALVRVALQARDQHGLPVCGVDLAGKEGGYPAADHQRAYALAHQGFLGKTVHAGEDYGPESIFQAITDCHADRIGHGTWLYSVAHVTDPTIKRKRDYITRLSHYIADRRITLEVCLTSNMQTIPHLRSMSDHPFGKMLKARLSTAICTDNRLISRTTATDEWAKAVSAFKLRPKQVSDLLVYGFKRSFFPGSYVEKRAFVRQILDYRDVVFARHGIKVKK